MQETNRGNLQCSRCQLPLADGDHSECLKFDREQIIFQFKKGSDGVACIQLQKSSFATEIRQDPEVREMIRLGLIDMLNQGLTTSARYVSRIFDVPMP